MTLPLTLGPTLTPTKAYENTRARGVQRVSSVKRALAELQSAPVACAADSDKNALCAVGALETVSRIKDPNIGVHNQVRYV